MKIKGKSVLITGACSGIGKIMARRCLEKGALPVIIWDINEEALKATSAELSAGGKGYVFGFKVDISDPASVEAAYKATKAACGDVNILINNAGIITNNKVFAEQTDADINRTFDINTKGAMFVTLRYLKDMKERGSGHICNVTSSAGMLALPRMSLYAASKWAAIGWSESVRIELEREKNPVKITTICPYFINTGMFEGIHSFFKIQDPEVVARKTLNAIERNLGYRGIPFSEHFIRLMQGLFPHRIFDFIFGDVCGLYTVMDHFTGRKK
jgi:short-subunit dehydrogenase